MIGGIAADDPDPTGQADAAIAMRLQSLWLVS
jgi:hypothetical protein